MGTPGGRGAFHGSGGSRKACNSRMVKTTRAGLRPAEGEQDEVGWREDGERMKRMMVDGDPSGLVKNTSRND